MGLTKVGECWMQLLLLLVHQVAEVFTCYNVALCGMATLDQFAPIWCRDCACC